ncbi:MAG TPA: hypothetical protein DEX36_07145 [Glutamicibacter sp.]|uniref:Hypothetical membrane protein n=1 Tax=Glutamicibacter arilaitensis (strain DSM 16368 / CIP 108037 / IAM 15318 / JCM 13566 / NCIMB 14258 / Re117) TaxID=861360 RepID=A0ABP1TZJ3_GLUAR|nr:hypothetical membrane protein [Glutamicibacter arilaitensis Re117]HCH47679.1 hypothetical protein [Glutamicibacter sp.]
MLGAALLFASIGLFAFALDTSQRSVATACWVTSTLMFICAAMLLLSGIVGASSVSAGEARPKRRR